MALQVSLSDVPVITAAEADIKKAMTEGMDRDLTAPVPVISPPGNYSPPASPFAPNAPTMARDTNRAIAAGVVRALRSFPVRLPTYTVATVPPAIDWAGAVVYVSNGAAGNPVIAFSDGVNWLRSDTLAVIS